MDRSADLVFFTPGFPCDESDTTCIPALQIFMREFKLTYEGRVIVIAFQYPYRQSVYHWNGIEVYSAGGANRRWMKWITWRRVKKFFTQLVANRNIRHLHSFWLGECALMAAKFSRQFGISHTCSLMGQDVLASNRYFGRITNMPLLICPSTFQRDQLSTHHGLKSVVIPWGIKVDQQLRTEKLIDIIGVGSLISLKRVDEFITVVKELSGTFPDINAKLIGEGPLFEELKQQVREGNLIKNVEFLGKLPYQKTQEKIAQSKVLLHMSDFESFGMVTIEALAYGTKVIAKPVGIAREIPEVTRINFIEEAVAEVKYCLENYQEGERILFTVESTVANYLKYFNKIGSSG